MSGLSPQAQSAHAWLGELDSPADLGLAQVQQLLLQRFGFAALRELCQFHEVPLHQPSYPRHDDVDNPPSFAELRDDYWRLWEAHYGQSAHQHPASQGVAL